MSVLYLQKRTHRAGAQTCLARLLRHAGLREWHPALACSQAGWLTAECERAAVPCFVEPFPSSRSLTARLFGNAAFARRIHELTLRRSFSPVIVHANDHLEGLLGLALARRLAARSAIFLRSPGMTREDYFKYRCREFNLLAVVGDELHARVKGWDAARDVKLIHDGIEVGELAPPKSPVPVFPRKILVIGSALDWKGWADLTGALFQLEQEGALPPLEFDFTGPEPEPAKNDLQLARLARAQCRFLGRVEAFRELVLGYDLVINPTRMESFGMAAVEVVALGVPLLSSRTGIIEQVIQQPEFLFEASAPMSLAKALGKLLVNWGRPAFDSARAQQNIREKFLVDHAVAKLNAEYARLTRD